MVERGRPDGRWSQVRGVTGDLVRESLRDRVPGLAAETAFFVVLGIFPGLLLAAGLLGVLDVVVGSDLAERAETAIVSSVDAVLTDQAGGALASVRDLFEQTRGDVLTLAAGSALVTVSGAFAVVIDALNIAYDTTERRTWWRRRLLGLVVGLITVLVVVVALAVVVVGPLLGRGPALAERFGLGDAFTFGWDVLRTPVLVVGVTLWLTTLFHVAPSRRTRWRDAVPGAVATTVLWLAASGGFHLYLRVVADANPVLGAFGGGVIVMTWVYLLSLALLVGGELNATLALRRADGAGPHDDPRRDAPAGGDPAGGDPAEPRTGCT